METAVHLAVNFVLYVQVPIIVCCVKMGFEQRLVQERIVLVAKLDVEHAVKQAAQNVSLIID